VAVNTKDLEHAMLYTIGCTDSPDSNGKINGCTIHINPSTIAANHSDAEVRSFLIHEMAHCFLYDRFGNAYDQMPAWYVEGAPTYAMVDLGTSSVRLSGIWQEYLDTPTRPLSGRIYAGWASSCTWPRPARIPGRRSTRSARPCAARRRRHARRLGRRGCPGRVRRVLGKRLRAGPLPRSGLDLHGGEPARIPAGAAERPAGRRWLAERDGARVRRRRGPPGHRRRGGARRRGPGTAGRVTLGGGKDAALDGGPFCTRGGCACPAGSARAGTSFTAMASGDGYLGLSGGAVAGSVTLTG